MACDGIAEFPPCLIALQKLFACVKWPCLLGIVHDDDAAWTQQPCRHLEIEESELEIMVAVNQDVAQLDTVVKDGDEIAFLPPFSGGTK